MIVVLGAGPLITVQDLGRPGHRAEGVGVTGAMDVRALRLANILVGNDESAACIEIAATGLAVRFEDDTRFAIAGGSCSAILDRVALPSWWTRIARKGQTLTIDPPTDGQFAYLAVAGGIDVDPVFGSRSTDLKGGFGGFSGRALARNDALPISKDPSRTLPADDRGGFGIFPDIGPRINLPAESVEKSVTLIRAIPAAEYRFCSEDAQRLFWNTDWELQRESNRVGYRFAGPALPIPSKELFSHGILPGVVQVPPSGQPVVQMVDANTSGGYPKMAVVIAADLGRLAQVRPRHRVRFVEATRDDAIAALRADGQYLNSVARYVALLKLARFAA